MQPPLRLDIYRAEKQYVFFTQRSAAKKTARGSGIFSASVILLLPSSTVSA